jgi:hypothetical protein
MPPHDSSKRDSNASSRLRPFVEKTDKDDSGRDRPGLASCKRAPSVPSAPAATTFEDDDDDGPITTRWAVG